MTTTTALVAAAVSDIISALGLPGGGTVSALIDAHLRRKAEAATSLLLEELRRGEVSLVGAVAQDDFISCLWRYQRAAIEGSAHTNLRLLARCLAGLSNTNELYAERFKRYADILSDLSAEEILVLATLHQICAALGPRETYYANKPMKHLLRLVPEKIPSEIHLHGVLAGLSRTGLISQGSGTMDDVGAWMTTPLMDEVAALAGIEDLGRNSGRYEVS